MSCVERLARLLALLALGLGAAGCDDLMGDLRPSDSDKRAAVVGGSVGYLPGQVAADFTVKDSLGNAFMLSDHLTGGSQPADVVVLYFTMWCPVCLSHTDHMYNQTIPRFRGRGTVVYGLVDYVSGSVAATRAEELANGYGGSDFTALADVDQGLLHQFHGAMGTVVAIASDGTILLNEDYRTGAALAAILEQQLP